MERFVREGAKVTLVDLATSDGAKVAESLGPNCIFAPSDITKEEDAETTTAIVTKNSTKKKK